MVLALLPSQKFGMLLIFPRQIPVISEGSHAKFSPSRRVGPMQLRRKVASADGQNWGHRSKGCGRLLHSDLCVTLRAAMGQNHMSRMHRPSLGKSSNAVNPSKWSIGSCEIASGSVNRKLTAMRRRPSASARCALQNATHPHVGQKWNSIAWPRT